LVMIGIGGPFGRSGCAGCTPRTRRLPPQVPTNPPRSL